MRPSILIPAALVAVGLAAQVPENLVERYNAGLAGVTQALKDLKYQEACAKADAMVPVKTPAFQGKDVPAILGSMEAGKGLLAILKLQANTQAVSGRWEKAQEIHLQRVGYAKALQKDLGEALEVQENSWKKIVVEGQAYIAQNEAKADELDKKLIKVQQDIKAFNDKTVKLDSKQMADLKARAGLAPRDQEQLDDMRGRIAGYKDALQRHSQFAKWSATTQRTSAELVKEAQGSLEKIEGNLKGQAAEIETFNAAKNAKKPRPKSPVTGAKAWVEAVMKDQGNLNKLPSPQEQANLLHRLQVLDPENASVAKSLVNLEQGKDPFFSEKTSKTKPAKKK